MEQVKIKSSWDNVTLKEYQEFCDIAFDEIADDVELNCQLLGIFSNQPYEFWQTVDYGDYLKAKDALLFLSTKPEPSEIKHRYAIAGRKYNIAESIPKLKKSTIEGLKACHYMGLCEKSKHTSRMTAQERLSDFHKELAIMMIPEGQEYGKPPYSISENAEYLQNNITIREALAVSAFFLALWKALTTGLKYSLEMQIKKMKKKSTEQEKIELFKEMMKTLDLLNPRPHL